MRTLYRLVYKNGDHGAWDDDIDRIRKDAKFFHAEIEIKYTSDNGYTGVLYGQSSLSIYNTDGTEIMHTRVRNINTYEELVRVVDEHPKFMEMLRKSGERMRLIDADDLIKAFEVLDLMNVMEGRK